MGTVCVPHLSRTPLAGPHPLPLCPPAPGEGWGGGSLTKAIGERGKEEVDSMLWPQPDPTRGQPSPAASGGAGGGALSSSLLFLKFFTRRPELSFLSI